MQDRHDGELRGSRVGVAERTSRPMNTDDFASGHDLDNEAENEAEHALVPYNDAAIDISRLQTQRLIAPEVVQAVSRRRQELADIHQAQAYRLRQMASGAMQR